MFFIRSLATLVVYITAVTAAPSVRNSIDLVARSQTTLPSGRAATVVTVEGDSDCAVGFSSTVVTSHDQLFLVQVDSNSDKQLCQGKLLSYLVDTPQYQESVTVAKRALAEQYGESHVEKRWNPVIVAFNAPLIGGSSVSATLTLGTVFAGFGLVAIGAGMWWGLKSHFSGSSSTQVKRSLDARATADEVAADDTFHSTAVIKVVGGPCTTSTCNGKDGVTFYAGFADYDSAGPLAQSISYDDDYDLTAQCLNEAHNAGYSNAQCRAWFEDNQGNYESVKLHYYLSAN
ncbi:hypothetical protein JCM10908_002237 [Rhodotorula pacifica]|uniref:uncharacterized protein n=1 Tax=Rhodotorula pacifica TaxID=1495444 RepID=UPI003173E757